MRKFLETKIHPVKSCLWHGRKAAFNGAWQKQVLIINLTITLALTLALSFAPALADTTDNNVDDLQKQRSDIQKKLEDIDAQIQKHQQAISVTRQAESSLRNEISIYNDQIQSTELQIQANNTRIEDTKLQINELQIQIEKRQNEITANKKVLAGLLVQLNALQNESGLNVGLGSKNFSAFLDQVQYTASVQSKVAQVIQNIKTVKAKLTAQSASLNVQVKKLQELTDELKISQDALTAQMQAKEKILNQTRGQEAVYQRLLNTSMDQEADLQKEIDDLDNSIRAKLGKLDIAPTSGALAYPMRGIMTQGYGNTGFTSLGYSFHNGIDLAGPAGTPIYAAANGIVIGCDTGEAAYGNWCALRHTIETKTGNRQIVTLYAHMRSFKVSSGQNVGQGDLIGYEGNTGNTTRLLYGPERGYHLHFSVFDAQGFGVSPGAYTKVYGHYTVPYGYTYNPLNFLH